MPNSFFFPNALKLWAKGDIHWDSGTGDTFVCFLIRTTSPGTANTDYWTVSVDATDMSTVPNNDECRTSLTSGVAMTNTTTPTTNGCLDADDVTFPSVAAGTHATYHSVIIAKDGATRSQDSIPLIMISSGSSFPVVADGNNITVQWAGSAPYIGCIGTTVTSTA